MVYDAPGQIQPLKVRKVRSYYSVKYVMDFTCEHICEGLHWAGRCHLCLDSMGDSSSG